MKTPFSVALVVLVWIVCSHQVRADNYYPLAVGNEWFYRDIHLLPGDSTIGSRVRVLGDSLFPNGHRYFVLSEEDIMGSRFVRTDSNSVFYINPFTGQESRVFKLDGQLGDTTQFEWGPFYTARLLAIDTVVIFQQPRRVLSFALDGIMYAILRFCDAFGPMTEWRFVDGPPPWPDWGRELVGCIINNVQYGRTLDIAEQQLTPASFELYQNYPNPFNSETRISYSLASRTPVQLRVFNVLGREVRTLVDQVEYAGSRAVAWDGRDNEGRLVSSGVYLYELRPSGLRQVKRMLLLK